MQPQAASSRRMILILAMSLALLIGALGIMAAFFVQNQPPAFNGTLLDPPDQAVGFSLADQRGRPFRLSDARGKVVVLTFLYTHCTDVCPFVAAKLKETDRLLGSDSTQVELVAITTDPARDTQVTLADYSRTFGLYDRWHFLYGPTDALRPLWKAYAVASEVDTDGEEHIETPQPVPPATLQALGLNRGLSADEVATAQQVIGQFGGGYHVTHSTPIWLIDPEGRVRVLLRQSASPEEIAHDVRLLLP
jgi:protein SCO1/2